MGIGHVVGVVDDGTLPDFGGKFFNGKAEDRRGLEFAIIGRTRVLPTAGDDVFGEATQCFELFGGVVIMRAWPRMTTER